MVNLLFIKKNIIKKRKIKWQNSERADDVFVTG